MGIKLQGGNNSTNLASVNKLHQLQVVTPQDLAGVSGGFVQISSEVDAGSILETRNVLPPETSDDYRLRAGIDQTIFNATFEGTVILTTLFNGSLSGFGSAQASGFLTINSSSAVTASNFGYYRTYRHFPVFGTYPLYLDMWIREANTTATNAISEWGFLYLTTGGTQQPIDGVYFRRISGGSLKGIITNNSLDLVEIDIGTTNIPSRDGTGLYDPSDSNHYLISSHNDIVRFWINDILVGEVQCPSQLAAFSASSSLPFGARVLNSTTASLGRQLSFGCVNIGLGDQNVNKSWSHAMSGMGGGAYQVQQGGTPGSTVTRAAATQGHPASGTARSAGAWSSTSNPALNNLGGLWTSPAISTILSDTDYPIFAFLNPTGSAALPGKTLYITGVRIGDTSATVGAATNAIFLSYIIQVEGSGSATSTSDSATTTAGKAITIGGQGFAATDIAGTMKPGFDMTFNPPLVIPASKYCSIIVRPFGTTTGNTLVVTGSVAFNGYFE